MRGLKKSRLLSLYEAASRSTQFTYGLHCIQIKVVFNLKQDAVAKLWLLQQGEKGETAAQI